MQHFATLLFATFLKKYVIKNCKLEEVAKKVYSFVSFQIFVFVSEAVHYVPPLIYAEGVMACKGKKKK